MVFPGHDFDESRHQRLVAAKLGTRHSEVPVHEHDLADRLRQMVRHAETPVRESYNVCSLKLSEAVRADGTVAVLTGEGADELFGGYPGYRYDAAGLGGSLLDGLDALLEQEIRERMWGVDIGYEQDQLTAQELRRDLYAPNWRPPSRSSPSPGSAWWTPTGCAVSTPCTSAPTWTSICASPTTSSATTATAWPSPTPSSRASPSSPAPWWNRPGACTPT